MMFPPLSLAVLNANPSPAMVAHFTTDLAVDKFIGVLEFACTAQSAHIV